MRLPDPRFNGVAVRVRGLKLTRIGPMLMSRKMHAHYHGVFHAAYSVERGQEMLEQLWNIAMQYANDPDVVMLVNTYKGGTP